MIKPVKSEIKSSSCRWSKLQKIEIKKQFLQMIKPVKSEIKEAAPAND